MLTPPDAICFDLDGTLVDTMPVHAAAFADVLAATHGVPLEVARAWYLRTAGAPLTDQFAQAPGVEAPDLSGLVGHFWELVASAGAPPFPDVPSALERLRGIPLFVSSGSSPPQVARKLHVAGIAHHFAGAWGDAPEPDGDKGAGHLRRAARVLGKTHPAFWFVGDGEHDMRLAVRAGAIGVGRAASAHAAAMRAAGARWTVETLDALAAAIGR